MDILHRDRDEWIGLDLTPLSLEYVLVGLWVLALIVSEIVLDSLGL